jgi:hypothetical protein
MSNHIDQFFLPLPLGLLRRTYDAKRVIPALKRQNATLRECDLNTKHMRQRGNESSRTDLNEGGLHTECTDERDKAAEQDATGSP